MGRLDGKVVLISDVARGESGAEAVLFAQEGAKVVLGDVLDAEGEQTSKAIETAGGQARYFHLDVTKEVEWQQEVDLSAQAFGGLNGLISNAGILRNEGVEKTTLDVWDRSLLSNKLAPSWG